MHSLFGGIAIRVPPDWHVESRIQVLAGGVDVRVPELEGSTAPVLTLDGLVLFGGVSVGARGAEAAFES